MGVHHFAFGRVVAPAELVWPAKWPKRERERECVCVYVCTCVCVYDIKGPRKFKWSLGLQSARRGSCLCVWECQSRGPTQFPMPIGDAELGGRMGL